MAAASLKRPQRDASTAGCGAERGTSPAVAAAALRKGGHAHVHALLLGCHGTPLAVTVMAASVLTAVVVVAAAAAAGAGVGSGSGGSAHVCGRVRVLVDCCCCCCSRSAFVLELGLCAAAR